MKNTLTFLRDAVLVILGSTLFALGFALFLEPHNLNCGGVSGFAMVMLEIIPMGKLTVGTLSFLINIPLFMLGMMKLGKKFFFGSLIGMIFSTLMIDVFDRIDMTSLLHIEWAEYDVMLSSLFGGVLTGAGLGVVFVVGASTGGSDILGRLIKNHLRNLPIGRIMLMMDIVVITMTGIVFGDIRNILYCAITLFLSAKVIDAVVYGLDYSKVAWIISDHYEQIAVKIDTELNRGVTLMQSQGYYARQDKSVLLCALKRKQVAELKELVNAVDPNAFVILQDAHQVLGDGFKSYNKNDL